MLEDDFLVSPSFFPYCKELLDKYEHDERINHICGFNLLGVSEHCPNDYLFAYNGSGAWASWRRVAKGWDMTYSFLHDEYAMQNLRKKYGHKYFDLRYKTALRHEKSGKAFWESILGFDCMLNNRYAIIPKYNLVSNIGMTQGSTHSNAEVELLPKVQQKIFNNPVHELEFPLKHPKYIVPDHKYMHDLDMLMGNGTPFRNAYRKLVYVVKCLLHGKGGLLAVGLKRRLNRARKNV